MNTKIKACVFDFGGVISPSREPYLVRPIAASAKLEWSAVVAGYGRYRRLTDGDSITMREMYEGICADSGIAPPDGFVDRLVAADAESYFVRDEGTISFMASLKRCGFKLGILTNMASSFVPHLRHVFADAVELADVVVVSGEERICKPDRAIYDICRERLALEASELCFFDDTEENCRAAREAGWHGIRFKTCTQIKTDFAAMTGFMM